MKLLEFASGTYSALIVDSACATDLYEFCEEIGLKDLVEYDDYHCTLIYSHQPCPDVIEENFNIPCVGTPKNYKILGTDTQVLVLELDCDNAEYLHNLFMEKYGATHDYPEYIPHITLTRSYSGTTLPSELPPFDILFTERKVEEIQKD